MNLIASATSGSDQQEQSAAITAAKSLADRTVAGVASFYERELVSIIGWAKQVPGATIKIYDFLCIVHSL